MMQPIGNAYYVFFVPMTNATRMPMPTVMGMPMTVCTGTSTIGKHAAWTTTSQCSPFLKTFLQEIFPLSLARNWGRGKGLVVPGDGRVGLVAVKADSANNLASEVMEDFKSLK